jgi:hypothetical protein
MRGPRVVVEVPPQRAAIYVERIDSHEHTVRPDVLTASSTRGAYPTEDAS